MHSPRAHSILHKTWPILLTTLIASIDLLHRFFPAWALYGAYDDDFFYYTQIARNLARIHTSTFDGIHLTNGYHPLWLLCLTLFSLIANGRLLFPLVTLTAALSLAAIFLLTLRIQTQLHTPLIGQYTIAALITFWSDLLLRGGMEITLAIPLLLLLISLWLQPTPRSTASFLRLGLLSSLCTLARLDSLILIVLLFSTDLIFHRPSPSAAFKRTAAFATGLLPLWLYLLSNKLLFGTLMPISAQAKQLNLRSGIHLTPLISLLHPFTTVRLLLVLPGLISIALLLIFLITRQTSASSTRPILWSLAFFPVLHLIALSFVSDWALWYWYFYPFILVSLGTIAVWTTRFPLASRTWTAITVSFTIVALGYTLAYHRSHPPHANTTFLAAREIVGFARTHPGTYAMGDRSGTVAWCLPDPLIQLEGLTMDTTYLNRLSTQPPLKSMLHAYNVQYYVSTNAVPQNGCYTVREPDQAGPDSAHMTATFCQPPEATFTHDGIITRIFNLPATPKD